MDDAKIKRARRQAINDIRQDDHQQTISMQMHAEATGHGFLDDQWDADGDSIVVMLESRFVSDGSPLVVAEFPQGSSSKMVARALRKFADILDGPKGYQVANLGDTDADATRAQRLPDGDVDVYNLLVEYRQYLADHENDAEEDDFDDD